MWTTEELGHIATKISKVAEENKDLDQLKYLIAKYPHLTDMYLDGFWEEREREIANN